jgi:hypothetical protein
LLVDLDLPQPGGYDDGGGGMGLPFPFPADSLFIDAPYEHYGSERADGITAVTSPSIRQLRVDFRTGPPLFVRTLPGPKLVRDRHPYLQRIRFFVTRYDGAPTHAPTHEHHHPASTKPPHIEPTNQRRPPSNTPSRKQSLQGAKSTNPVDTTPARAHDGSVRRRWWIATVAAASLAPVPAAPAAPATPAASAAPASAAPAALAPAAPATRPTRSTRSTSVELVGSLTIAWQGDQARGCAAAGLCGVSGSLQMLPSGGSSGAPGPPPLELSDPSSVARVVEQSPSGITGATCADLVPVDFVFGVGRSSAGGLRAVVDEDNSVQLPSAGRCAGPTAKDLSALELPARRLGSHGYDLSGRATFGAGPFAVTAISSVRALFSRGSGGTNNGASGTLSTVTVGSSSSPPPAGVRTRVELQEHAELVYRIAGVDGGLTTTFAGLAAPFCDPLGACGTSGELAETFSANGTLGFFGSRIVKRRVGSRAALADLRAGRLELERGLAGLPIGETVTETLRRPDGTECADSSTEDTVLGSSLAGERHSERLALDPSGGGGLDGSDSLRTRCPGPSGADILGSSSLAAATLPDRALGTRRLAITFRSAGSFSSSAYAGERGGSVVLSLVRAQASGGTSREPIIVTAPPVP